MHDVVADEVSFLARGEPVRALLFRPDAPGRHPAVVLGMEATGINRLIRRVGTELARAGYVAFVPDYYRGGGPPDPEDLSDIPAIMEHVGALSFVEATRDVHDALDHVRALDAVDPGRVAVWGYCTGATIVLLAACTRRDLAAAVLFYPSQPWFEQLDAAHPVHPVDLLWGLACPVLVLYGDQDVVMSADQLADVRGRLGRWGVDHDVRVYPGAGHAFLAEAEGFHHPEAAAASSAAAHEFLLRRVPPGARVGDG